MERDELFYTNEEFAVLIDILMIKRSDAARLFIGSSDYQDVKKLIRYKSGYTKVPKSVAIAVRDAVAKAIVYSDMHTELKHFACDDLKYKSGESLEFYIIRCAKALSLSKRLLR